MYLIDTNILIYYLDGNQQVIEFIGTHDAMAISVISVIEVLSYPYNPEEKAIVVDFLVSNFTWLYIDNDVAFLTAYNRTLKKIKTPDAIIGATAIHHECTLITNNVKDFVHLPITIVNPLN